MTILDGARRILLAHAHPDDETLSTGALAVRLRDEGVTCDLLTATRGEMGEATEGPWQRLQGTPELEVHRAGELAGALSELGIDKHFWLGTAPAREAGLDDRRYRDSGMQWVTPTVAGPADSTDERAFSVASVDEEVADLAALLTSHPVDAVVSYDPHGGYGHPDHVRMWQVAREACRLTGTLFVELWPEPGPEADHEVPADVEWHHDPQTLPRVAAALRHHASQLTVQPSGDEVVHVGGQREAIRTSYGLRRA